MACQSAGGGLPARGLESGSNSRQCTRIVHMRVWANLFRENFATPPAMEAPRLYSTRGCGCVVLNARDRVFSWPGAGRRLYRIRRAEGILDPEGGGLLQLAELLTG